MQKDQLLELRNKIVHSTQEIALKGTGSPVERLQVLMSIIHDGEASTEVLTRAFELAQSIEGDDDKLTSLLDLLYAIDVKLGEEEVSSESQPAQDAPQPEQEHDQHEQHDQHGQDDQHNQHDQYNNQ